MKTSKSMAGHYVLFVWDDVDPQLYGPYATCGERDEKAKALRMEEGGEHGIFWLDRGADGRLEVGPYSGSFFEDGK